LFFVIASIPSQSQKGEGEGMEVSRRDFLKASGAGLGGIIIWRALGSDKKGFPKDIPLKKNIIGETSTICCYCSVGCGAVVATSENLVVNLEGDPDHPINQGSLCPKGQAMLQINNVDGAINPYRLTKPLYRAPGASDFTEISWDDAIERIAARVKETRDRTFIKIDSNGKTVNRTEAIGSFGGGELDNEECYILSKMDRALGLVYIEHCARL
jgi:formate dehydrogenase major subunit